MSNIVTLDTEVGIHNRGDEAVGKNKASPFHPDNHIVYLGRKRIEENKVVIKQYSNWWKVTDRDANGMIVGQNIKFDIHYLMKDVEGFREHVWPSLQIWDTMLAEYLLTGQVSQYASLDKLAEKYGGTLKDDRLKDFWKQNIETEDIAEEIIVPYLENDVLNTELVFKKQLERAKELGMLPLLKTQMEALKATTEMEWNGMVFDKRLAKHIAEDLNIQMGRVAFDAMDIASGYVPPNFNIHLGSTKSLAVLLFGGDYIVIEDDPVLDEDGYPITYKTGKRKGQTKTRKVKKIYTTTGFGIPTDQLYKTDTGLSTSESVLRHILKHVILTADTTEFINSVLQFRKLQKDISTYFEGYSNLVWHDGMIHHQLNHVGTDTGRLSSSKPNLQNVTSKKEE